MGITVTWDHEADKRTIRFDIDNYWTWEDFKQALDTVNRLIEGIASPVNLILNLQPGFRPRIAAPEQIKAMMDAYTAHLRQVVVVSDDLFIKKEIDTFSTTYPASRDQLHVVPTLDGAREYIAKSYQAPGAQ